MMHASDYSNMGYDQMRRSLNNNRKKDDDHAASLQLVKFQNILKSILLPTVFFEKFISEREAKKRKYDADMQVEEKSSKKGQN